MEEKYFNYIKDYLNKNFPGLKDEPDYNDVVTGVMDLYLQLPERSLVEGSAFKKDEPGIRWALKTYFENKSKIYDEKLLDHDIEYRENQKSKLKEYYKETLYDESYEHQNDSLADIQGRHL